MEAKLFSDGEVPDWTTPEWYAQRERAPHLEQGAHVGRLKLAETMVREIATTNMAIVDLGAGDGGLLSLLQRDGYSCWGYDLQVTNVNAASDERRVDVQLCDVVGFPHHVRWAPVAVCTEMLEHLVDPHGFVRRIQSNWLIASSPVNETAESHYAFHLWAWDMDGYAALLDQGGFRVDAHECIDGFQVIRGRRA